jgi:hypothetical protein
MPDIQTALTTALTQSRVREIPADWDENNSTKESTVKPNLFQTANNVTRETFNFVRDNPGLTGKQIKMRMEAQGFNASSVGSLLGQFVRTRMLELHMPTKAYRAIATEYTPIKSGQLKASRARELKEVKKAIQAIKKQQPVAGIATLTAPRTQATLTQPVSQQLTAKQVLETLSIKEAHMLYRELQTMFGD